MSVGLTDRIRGAKVAMTLALRGRRSIESVISVDNAPADAALKNDFARYIQGMQKILETGITKQTQADEILQQHEKVYHRQSTDFHCLS